MYVCSQAKAKHIVGGVKPMNTIIGVNKMSFIYTYLLLQLLKETQNLLTIMMTMSLSVISLFDMQLLHDKVFTTVWKV